MCDLWQLHDRRRHAAGRDRRADRRRARRALRARRAGHRQIKLYNAGSFFDPRAVPEADYDDIAAALAGLSRVIVESHPALVGARVDRFLAALDAPSRATPSAALEVAMGLETAHPERSIG